ncbi:hypothetical protein EV643_104240 [Kribbella sp. VKM Ac-2527]|uniref:Uncharacterized protein n=1 Tax=Kribbella caucasensis TaxID=2512215 RepID=A0A4R6KI73_9ACTN|nr:hypothetical protein [Kribbella sp. VKM Ac-2527]TDO50743.1 hypothetical protein EV643_104240 [Kribbella sp. VKM Ac-2527]
MRGKLARPVLRGLRRGNAPELPDERWFAELTNRKLRRFARRRFTELEATLAAYCTRI